MVFYYVKMGAVERDEFSSVCLRVGPLSRRRYSEKLN